MKAISCLFVAAIVLTLLGETSGQGPMAPLPIQYTVTGETCRTVGSGQPLNCKSCSSTIYPDPKCASGQRCFAIDCTKGATEFDGCTSGAGGGNCPSKGGTAAMKGCGGCTVYSGSCVELNTCTTPGCVGAGVPAPPPTVLKCTI